MTDERLEKINEIWTRLDERGKTDLFFFAEACLEVSEKYREKGEMPEKASKTPQNRF